MTFRGMKIVERGHGEPLVVVPGLQGRWEYVRAAVDSLAAHFRVITFSLCDEPSSGWRIDPSRGVDGFADQVGAALDDRGLDRAAICGISFGGLIALRYAARTPARMRGLVLVSAPGPGWHLKPRHEMYARLPWLFGPIFLAESPLRLRREILAAYPDMRGRLGFLRDQIRTVAEAPLSASRMAARARLIASHDRMADCRAISCPTLVVHGDPALDHVVDAGGTREYGTRISGAELVTLEHTGHLGSITRPREFSAIVRRFLDHALQGSHDSAA